MNKQPVKCENPDCGNVGILKKVPGKAWLPLLKPYQTEGNAYNICRRCHKWMNEAFDLANRWDWDKLKKGVEAEDPYDGEKKTYLGSMLSITPSCKLYMFWSTNVTELEADRDSRWREELDAEAEKHGLYVTGSDGDMDSIMLGMPWEAAEGELENAED